MPVLVDCQAGRHRLHAGLPRCRRSSRADAASPASGSLDDDRRRSEARRRARRLARVGRRPRHPRRDGPRSARPGHRRAPWQPGAGWRGAESGRGERAIASARRSGPGLRWTRRSGRAYRRSRSRRDRRSRARASRCRPGRRARHARSRVRAVSREARAPGREGHGARLRCAHERDDARNRDPARRAGGRGWGTAGAGPGRRHGYDLDVAARRLDLLVDDDELARRRREIVPLRRYLLGATRASTPSNVEADGGCDSNSSSTGARLEPCPVDAMRTSSALRTGSRCGTGAATIRGRDARGLSGPARSDGYTNGVLVQPSISGSTTAVCSTRWTAPMDA